MLRFFKQHYPIRNFLFVIGEGCLIILSVYVASLILLSNELSFAVHGYLILKIILIGFICQTCLYYFDLYNLEVIDSYSELSIRLLQALGTTAILLAIIYFLLFYLSLISWVLKSPRWIKLLVAFVYLVAAFLYR